MAADPTRTATPDEHKATAPTTLGCWVLTISDTIGTPNEAARAAAEPGH